MFKTTLEGKVNRNNNAQTFGQSLLEGIHGVALTRKVMETVVWREKKRELGSEVLTLLTIPPLLIWPVAV